MTMSESLEAAMLIAFSSAWYWSIARMLRVGAALGKSLTHASLIAFGYALGVAAKVALWRDGAPLSPIVWLYAWNCLVVLADVALVLHFSRRLGVQAAMADDIDAG